MTSTSLWQRLARDPLIHFLLIGAGIYGAYALLDKEPTIQDNNSLTITQEEIRALTEQWTGLWNRPPTEEELAGILRKHVRTQVLYREALAMGLDRQDPVIERRLAQKVELLSKSLVTPDPPSDEILAEWYARNNDQFRGPDTYTLYQVFFDPDRRGQNASTDAETALAALAALPTIPDDVGALGDTNIMQSYYAGRSVADLSRTFGRGFIQQVADLEPGRWHGPILSGFGVHLVYVERVDRASTPELADTRDAVQQTWMLEQVEQRSEEFIEELVDRYDIVVEPTEVPMTVSTARTEG